MIDQVWAHFKNLLLFGKKKKKKGNFFYKHNTENFTILVEGTTIAYSAIGQRKTIVLQ